MERTDAIRSAYRLTGSNSFYDGMITCSTVPCAVWYGAWDGQTVRIIRKRRCPAFRRALPDVCWRCRLVPAY